METNKYYKALELDKILDRAAGYALCSEARTRLLEQPAAQDADEARWALRQTDSMTTLLLKNGSPRFSPVEGLEAIVQRASKGGVLSMAELLRCAAVLRNFRTLNEWYHITEHDMLPVDDLFYGMTPQPTLEKQITEAILSEEEMADTASDQLYQLRRKIRQTESSIRDRLDQMIKNPNSNKYLQDAVVSIRNGRFVVPVKAEFRGEVGGVIHDVSSSGATLFVEPTAVVEANAKIMQLRSQEAAEMERILEAFTSQIAQQEQAMLFGYGCMLDIDVLLAKARLALAQNATMPEVTDQGWFCLKKARHPLIDPAKVVPIDVELGQSYDTMVITGPNTGGKTVTLKTAGLLCAMAQQGLLIPALAGSTVCVFSDYMVPAMRIAAIARQQAIYVFSHDSYAVGEDGATHQPVEQLACMRATPNVTVIRPADAAETAEAWLAALRRTEGPTALLLSRQTRPVIDRVSTAPAAGTARGAYTLVQNGTGTPDLILMASGSETALALDAARARPQYNIRVVSFPSWELFEQQSREYRESVLPPACTNRISVEAGCSFGWSRYVGDGGESIALDSYGASAPAGVLAKEFGFTVERILARIDARLG